MAKNKTVETTGNVVDFINLIENETKRDDSFKITEIFKEQTGFEPKMWGPSIIGFGTYHYKYDSGREGDAPLAAFSPRKNAISIYLSSTFDGRDKLLEKLGKHKTTKACIYVNKLSDINIELLKEMIVASINQSKNLNQSC
ncbi:DUF1801 domain-containing protein [Pedobacter foliorum]|uniref:DUF1801 domain-containing protein n=1 Tax=Pedobacter foliorum TaxID=2739058 RepID=UPI001565C249|nr:DUF1801 domain-containing protein [Pedobacter foliorum]NRF37129.1 DUF1801 domain-containing protein [Pedobacter foliorum]